MTRAAPGAPLAFLEFVVTTDADVCLLWPFSRSADGYGVLRYDGRVQGAHRVSLVLATGEDPAGLDACHAAGIGCSRACVNPAHLRFDTRSNNLYDIGKDWRLPSQQRVRRPPQHYSQKVVLSFPGWVPRSDASDLEQPEPNPTHAWDLPVSWSQPDIFSVTAGG